MTKPLRDLLIEEVVGLIKEGRLHCVEVNDYLAIKPHYKRALDDSLMIQSLVYADNVYLKEFLIEYDSDDHLFKTGASSETEPPREYTGGLISLFHGHTELIDQLTCLSDDEIKTRITAWAREKDNLGSPLIENPKNYGNKTKYAKCLKENNLIKLSEKQFRQNL